MTNLAPKKSRAKEPVKVEEEPQLVKAESRWIEQRFEVMTPPKRFQMTADDEATVKEQDQAAHLRSSPLLYQSYRLDYLNSISYQQGKLCNLLTIPSEKYRNGRKVKCKCSKSKCESRYCECFSRGSVCGVDCECTNCHNLVAQQASPKGEQDKGCRCSKSRCLKNYCECFQRGEQCGDKCQCVNCGNVKL